MALHAEDKTYLSKAINNLSSDSIQIVYSSDFIDANEIELNSPINNIEDLNTFLNTINYQLQEIKSSIYLIKPQSNSLNSKTKDKTILIGDVIDSITEKKILGAQIYINNQPTPLAITKKSGFALIDLLPEIYEIKVEAKGYIDQKFTIDLFENDLTSKQIKLIKAPEKLENLLVTASLFDFFKIDQTNQNIMTFDELESTPHLGNDPTRAVTKIPGLTSNGISARHHARGGKETESQVVLNGLSLRNPYHFKDFFGVFSTVNLNYVKELSVFAGVFPAKYGNYISSVMDIQSKTPDQDLLVDTSIGLLNSHITIGDTLDSGTQYIVSYRSGGDILRTDLVEVDVGEPSYNDFFLDVTHDFSNGVKIKGNILHSKDKISLNLINEDEVANAKYIDNNYWSSITIPVNESFNINSMISYQTSNTNRSGELFDNEVQGSIYESRNSKSYGASANIEYQFNNKSLMTIGANLHRETTQINYISIYSGHDFIGDILNPKQIDNSRNHDFNNSGYSSSLYGNFRYKFNDKFYSDIGIRIDNQNWTESNQISPRLNFSYIINDSSLFRFGLGRHFQQQHIDGVLLEDETLNYFEPEAANIGVIEFQKQFSKTYSFRSEVYYKNYTLVHPYYENLFIGLHLHPELFTDRIRLQPDSAFSRGIDFSITHANEKYDWSISYSFSEAKDDFNGTEVLRSWDQKNAIKYSHNWYFGNWQIGSLLQFHSGWPRTPIYQNPNGDIVIEERNTQRNKAYINLDLRVSYDVILKSSKIKYWFQLNNATNRNNQCCTEYSYEENENGEYILLNEQKQWLPILPSLGVNFSF